MSTVKWTMVEPGIIEVRLSRPEALSTLTWEAARDFHDALDSVQANDTRVVILTGAGRLLRRLRPERLPGTRTGSRRWGALASPGLGRGAEQSCPAAAPPFGSRGCVDQRCVRQRRHLHRAASEPGRTGRSLSPLSPLTVGML